MTNSTVRSDSDLQGHTPGPWFVSKGSPYYVCNDGFWIASTMGIKGPEGEANARLIAAAPELLSQLEYAVKLLGAFPTLNGTAQVQSMRDTLAKATGAA